MVDARYFLAGYLGLPDANPFADLLSDASSIEEIPTLPALSVVRRVWSELAPTLDACLGTLDEDELRSPSRQLFPVSDPSLLGAISFMIQHESYHIGQLALLRKYLGHPAMKYG